MFSVLPVNSLRDVLIKAFDVMGIPAVDYIILLVGSMLSPTYSNNYVL